MHRECWWGDRERDGKIILKWVLGIKVVRIGGEWNLLRMVCGGGSWC
jgi:hypothetical protein